MRLPYLALAGPTASGKTDAALALAHYARTQCGLALEIVSVDSALIYRGMDIGTAKPSAAQRAAVPHHLIDIAEPTQSYSAAQFAREASALLRDIHARGRVPLLVGGTMLYFKALACGLAALPAADASVRARIASDMRTLGCCAMHERLRRIDPLSAQRLSSADTQRVGRALEVWEQTGQTLSHWLAQGSAQRGHAPTLMLSLEPAQRAWLHERIAQRFDAMLQAGFLDEMQRLRARGDLHTGLPSMRCVGYRQAWQALDAQAPLPVWRLAAIAATRQLAKRQLTWLRHWQPRTPIACDAPEATQQLLQHAAKALANWP